MGGKFAPISVFSFDGSTAVFFFKKKRKWGWFREPEALCASRATRGFGVEPHKVQGSALLPIAGPGPWAGEISPAYGVGGLSPRTV